MLNFNNLKTILLLLLLAMLAGCNSTPTTVDSVQIEPTPNQTASDGKELQAYSQPEAVVHRVVPTIDISAPVSEPENITLAPNTDLWQRIRDGYGIPESKPLHTATQKQLNWFIKHPDYIDRVVERARPYLHYIVDQLEQRNMPMEIALLPVVESGFQPFAYSHGRAAGIWQFIPGTGRLYGLKQNWWYDGRRDVIASTGAALDYLEKLYGDFGDWQLALAAYNSGEGTVGRAIKRNKKAGKATDFWSLDLPRETSAYVPKLIAVAELVKRPAHYNITLSPIDDSPFLAVVDVGSQIDLALAAQLAEISTDEMYQLNPGFNQWATTPDGPHRLVVPLE